MSTTADEEIKEAMSQAVEKVRDLHRNVQSAPTKDDEEWFRNLLGILTCTLLDYYSVKVGAEKSVYLLAWACRNLLELKHHRRIRGRIAEERRRSQRRSDY